MNIPFSIEQFLGVFEKYNLAIWPMQIIAYILGIAALLLAIGKTKLSDRIICAVLVFFWLWMGIAYHIMYFSKINKAAFAFGVLFIIQGILFLIIGLYKTHLSFKFKLNTFSLIGSLFILYAMVIYPILGYFLGHGYPKSPGFGVAPCPTTIFTFGLLLWTDKKVAKYILVIPFIWSIIGFSAVIAFGMREDIGLLITALLGTIAIIFKDRKKIE
jgi:hypothetical protein